MGMRFSDKVLKDKTFKAQIQGQVSMK